MNSRTNRSILFFLLILALLICGGLGIFLAVPAFASADNNMEAITFTGYDSGIKYSDGSFVNESIIVEVTDNSYEKLFYKTPSINFFTFTRNKKYVSGRINGQYTVYAGNDDGTRSTEYSFYYDNVIPEGVITSNDEIVESGSYINDSFSYTASDDGSGIVNIFYKTPIDEVYKPYISGTVIPAYSNNGWYYFYSVDNAGNESAIASVCLATENLTVNGTWKADGEDITNGGYTNKSLSFIFDENKVTATYLFNGSECGEYISGQVFTEDGTYTIILLDNALNRNVFTAHIDTVAPTGQLYTDYETVESGTFTNGKVYFSWDGNLTATVNGSEYKKNTVLTEDGTYTFVLTDLAGNASQYEITIDTVCPSYNSDKLSGAKQMISKWHVVKFDDSDYSFATYEEALTFACDKEFANLVTVLYLENIEDFNQHHLVANGSEVRTGEYWLYKSKTNPDSFLYYFDRDLLNEVVAHYAKDYISPANYCKLNGKNNYGTAADSMSDNLCTASDGTSLPVLNGFVFDEVDSIEIYAEIVGGSGTRSKVEFGIAFDKQFSIGGIYKLIEIDAAKNETVYYGFLDVSAPELQVTAKIYGNVEPTQLTITENSLKGIAAYYYESFNVNEIVDADKWAVLTIEKGNTTRYYSLGDELPCLNISGEYLLTVYDRFNNTYSFKVYIVGNSPAITIRNNSDNTSFNLTISLEQSFDTLVSLEIRRNGELLDGISTDKLTYTFDLAGVYTIMLRDNFGREIKTQYTFGIIDEPTVSDISEGSLNGGAIALIVICIIVLGGGVAAVLFMRKKGIFGKIKALKTDSEKPKKD